MPPILPPLPPGTTSTGPSGTPTGPVAANTPTGTPTGRPPGLPPTLPPTTGTPPAPTPCETGKVRVICDYTLMTGGGRGKAERRSACYDPQEGARLVERLRGSHGSNLGNLQNLQCTVDGKPVPSGPPTPPSTAAAPPSSGCNCPPEYNFMSFWRKGGYYCQARNGREVQIRRTEPNGTVSCIAPTAPPTGHRLAVPVPPPAAEPVHRRPPRVNIGHPRPPRVNSGHARPPHVNIGRTRPPHVNIGHTRQPRVNVGHTQPKPRINVVTPRSGHATPKRHVNRR
jgi:hypothetical protein